MNFIIISDVAISGMYAHANTKEGENVIWIYIYIKSALLSVYSLETLLILLGKDFTCKQGDFIFNSLVLIIALIELVISITLQEIYVGLSVIRAVSLIQIFKYTKFWSQLSSIIKSFVESMQGVAGLMTVLIIVLTIYALLGNQLFSQSHKRRESLGTFDTFFSSLLLSFVLLTGDNWTTYLAESNKNSESIAYTAIIILYFLSFVVIGNFILMNVFLGIIVDNLTSDYEETHEEEDLLQKQERINKLTLKSIGMVGKFYKNSNTNQSESKEYNTSQSESINESTCCCSYNNGKVQDIDCMGAKEVDNTVLAFVDNTVKNTMVKFSVIEKQSSINDIEFKGISPKRGRTRISLGRGSLSFQVDPQTRERIRAFSLLLDPDISHPIPKHKSLFLFDCRNKFRQDVFTFVTSSVFTMVIGVAIISSSLVMAFEDPLGNDEKKRMMNFIDYVFTGKTLIITVIMFITYHDTR